MASELILVETRKRIVRFGRYVEAKNSGRTTFVDSFVHGPFSNSRSLKRWTNSVNIKGLQVVYDNEPQVTATSEQESE